MKRKRRLAEELVTSLSIAEDATDGTRAISIGVTPVAVA